MQTSGYFDIDGIVDEAERRRGAGARRRRLRRHHPRRLRARPGARRAPADPRRGGRHRPGRHGERARRAAGDRPPAALRRERAARRPRTGGAPVDVVIHRRYNPEGDHRLQHRARPARRHPDHDDDPDDGAGADPRDRARHDREPARDAGAAARDHGRQDRALYRLRLRAGRGHPGRARCSSSRVPMEGSLAAALLGDAPLHRRQRDARLHHSRRWRGPRCRRCR